ncbi:hypothetical protein IE53DRAFT_383864 [Violaceomyces palustris]|uniref:Uncharacterized protein n=1 Tax=Violaceomyces palustris TaxID=1673888 RepID=A0ACD0P6E3_9BASI|nr:hypothetical protein IE53DRAFT_383864 [Violaceomyces palustris]
MSPSSSPHKKPLSSAATKVKAKVKKATKFDRKGAAAPSDPSPAINAAPNLSSSEKSSVEQGNDQTGTRLARVDENKGRSSLASSTSRAGEEGGVEELVASESQTEDVHPSTATVPPISTAADQAPKEEKPRQDSIPTRTLTSDQPVFKLAARDLYVSSPKDRKSLLLPRDLQSPLRNLLADERTYPNLKPPKVILIFGWMDATLKLVTKYAVPYTILFPDSTIIIKLSDAKSYLAREVERRRRLEEVVRQVVQSYQQQEGGEEGVKTIPPSSSEGKEDGLLDSTVTLIETPRDESRTLEQGEVARSNESCDRGRRQEGLLIHSFSDGGASNLSLFLSILKSEQVSKSLLSDLGLPRPRALIMDSSPGKTSARSGSEAFTVPLAKRPLVRYLVKKVVFLGLLLLRLWTRLRGRRYRGDVVRDHLNSSVAWNWFQPFPPSPSPSPPPQQQQLPPPRLYLYSKSDNLIPYKFVEEHAQDLCSRLSAATKSSVKPNLVEMEGEARSAAAAEEEDVSTALTLVRVELRRWDKAPHCGIARYDFQGYWNQVISFLRSTLTE